MTEDVIKELQAEKPSKFHESMLTKCKALVMSSRTEMSKRYSDWDFQDSVYRGERCLDQDDMDQERKGKPTKMIVPNTYAQVSTFVSFLFLMYKQNRTFFELAGSGIEDEGSRKIDSETLLDQNCRYNQWDNVVFQNLLDTARFGPGVIETSWTRKISRIYVTPEPTVININGVTAETRAGSGWEDVVKYEGNLVRAVSPYRFFPDVGRGLPLTEWHRGEFCAAEEDYTMAALRELESVGEVAGIEHIQPLPKDYNKLRGGSTRSGFNLDTAATAKFDSKADSQSVLVTKMQWWLVPNQFEIEGNKVLGPETFPVLYHVWYANDNRIIRCEPAYWWHNEFGWSVTQFTPDMHMTINCGLADLIYRLQDVISWYVNSHISSVRRVMQNRLIVDPKLIDTKSLDGEGDVYLRKGVSVPLDRAVGQLKVQDVTQGHMGDVDTLNKIMEMVTGVNGNAMGQYNGGRRSAQEARVVTAGAAGRMKMHGHLIWESGYSRVGRHMISNLRQSISQDFFNSCVGELALTDPSRYPKFKGTPQEVARGMDYAIFDSTLASEKGFIAQSLQELLMAIMSNPIAAQQLDLDPRAMLQEIQYLRGAGSVQRFSLSRTMQQGATPLPPALVPPTSAPATA